MGPTVATNAILERKGVRTALVTTKGFEDVIAIGRQNRSRLYDLAFRREPAIVPEELRFGIPGRMLQTGEEYEPFDAAAAEAVIKAIREQKRRFSGGCACFFPLPTPNMNSGSPPCCGSRRACPYPFLMKF